MRVLQVNLIGSLPFCVGKRGLLLMQNMKITNQEPPVKNSLYE